MYDSVSASMIIKSTFLNYKIVSVILSINTYKYIPELKLKQYITNCFISNFC